MISIPENVMAEAKAKWPRISDKTQIAVTNRESLTVPVMKAEATFDLDAITRWAAEQVAWYLGEGDVPESRGEFTLLKITPEPFIRGWDAAYNPDKDIVVFRRGA